jgi:hypothetical protein
MFISVVFVFYFIFSLFPSIIFNILFILFMFHTFFYVTI